MSEAFKDLRNCDAVIEKIIFHGTDQNPKGIRDTLYCAITAAEKAYLDVVRERNELKAAKDDLLRFMMHACAPCVGFRDDYNKIIKKYVGK